MAESDNLSEAVKCLTEMSEETPQSTSKEEEGSTAVDKEVEIPRPSATDDHDYVEGAESNPSHEKLDIINLPSVPVVDAVESVHPTALFSSPRPVVSSKTIADILQPVKGTTKAKFDQSWTSIGVWSNPYKGYLSSHEELERAIKMYTEETDSRWVVSAKDKLFSSTDIKLSSFKIFWRGREDDRKAVFPDFDGLPFIMVGRKSWGCHLGRDKCRSGKIKYRTKLQDDSQEGTDDKWPLIRSSKKLGCPATLSGVHILKFRDFPMSPNMSEFHRKQTLRRLRLSLLSKHSIVKAEQRFYINLSKLDEHIHETNPPQDSVAPTLRVEKRLIYKLTELYHSGVLRLADMNKEIEKYVKELYKDEELPSKEVCPELYPSLNCQHFLISHAVKVTSLLEMDLGHCHRLISGWQVEFPNDSWYYQPFASCGPIKRAKNKQNKRLLGHYPDMKQTFLFCCQNEGQRQLLHTYGSVCVLDSPHGKTVLPTYFLLVRTNAGYQVVSTIIMQFWNSSMLVEAMQVIKDWNPDWQPKALLVEMIEDEVPVLEVLFPECQVLVSFIHRERAWLDFFSNEEDQSYVLSLLDPMFFAKTKEDFNNALKALQETPLWTENKRFQFWMRVRWLPCYPKWSIAFFSEETLFTMCANNGLDLLREALEYTWLENVRSRSLSELLTCLAMDELPRLFKSYTKENISMQAATRYQVNPKLPMYVRHLPVPVRPFINEVLSSTPTMQVVLISEGRYLVSFEDVEDRFRVSFGTEDEYPSCDCWTWKSKMEICEHFCAVFKQCINWHWCKLSPLYTDNPIFKIDQSQLDLPFQDTPRCGDQAQTDIFRNKEFFQVAMDDFGAVEEVLEHNMSSDGDADTAGDDMDDMDDVVSDSLELNVKQTTCNNLLERLGQVSKHVTNSSAMDFMTTKMVELLKQMQQYDSVVVVREKRGATPSSSLDNGEGRKKSRSGPSPPRVTRQVKKAVSLSNNSPQKQLHDLDLGSGGGADFTGDS
ncbi:uncharacterized protein [Asterias amurensis]|uniref:uncharacterized protein n=1 Tax=Asterias amurensis TaxID=7602 RepID=UPI003AB22E82